MPVSMIRALASAPAAAFGRLLSQQQNHTLDLVSGAGLGATMAVVSALLPSIARARGLDALGLAALAALPYLAGLMTLVAGHIGPRGPARMALMRAAGALGLLLVVIAPDPLFIALATLGFWASFSLGSPLQQRIWATIYSADERGRKIGRVGTARSAAGTAALIIISLLAIPVGAGAILLVVALTGAVLSLAMARMEVPGVASGRRFGARDSIRSALGSPVLRQLAVAQVLFGAGLVATPALIAMVYVDRLGLDVGAIALAGLAGYAATAVAFSLWGRFASTRGSLPTIALGALAGVLAILLFAEAAAFITVLVASVMLGASGAAIAVAWPLLIGEHAPDDDQAAAAAGLDAIMSLRGLVIPFVVMAPVSAGLLDASGGLVLCALAMAAGTLVFGRLSGLDMATLRRALASFHGLMLGDATSIRTGPASGPAAPFDASGATFGIGSMRMH